MPSSLIIEPVTVGHTKGAYTVAVALLVVVVRISKKSSQKEVPSQSNSSKMQSAEEVSPRRHSRP